MLKAYAVAVALSTTTPVAIASDAVAQPIKDPSQSTQIQKGYKKGRSLIIPLQEAKIQKGYKKGRSLIIPN